MKTSMTTSKVLSVAIGAEALLLLIQFGYLKIAYPGVENVFSSQYMQGTGFYIFQILGFLIFVLVAQYVFKRSGNNIFRNAVLLFLPAALIEVGFYLVTQAAYQGAFLFSVMDILVAIAFGVIVTFVSKQGMEKKQAESR